MWCAPDLLALLRGRVAGAHLCIPGAQRLSHLCIHHLDRALALANGDRRTFAVEGDPAVKGGFEGPCAGREDLDPFHKDKYLNQYIPDPGMPILKYWRPLALIPKRRPGSPTLPLTPLFDRDKVNAPTRIVRRYLSDTNHATFYGRQTRQGR